MEPSPTSGRPVAATYGGTGGTLLRSGGWAVLLGVRPGHPLVQRCWEQLGTTSDPDDLLETIAAQGLRTVPAFALVRETGVRRVVARGVLALVLDGTDALADRHAGAWVDLPLADVTTVDVSLTTDALPEPRLPLRDGVTAAAGFGLALEETVALPGPAVDGVRRADETQPFVETFTPAAGREAGTVTVRVRRPAVATTSSSSVEAPRVLAAVCAAGHLTPAYSGVCRVCRLPVAAQAAFETPRPVLGRLVLPLGGTLLLDRGAVLGRAPHVPRDWAGPQPSLVPLPDPDHDVSAQHVSVVLDLWNVLVCDLGSTNGTALVDEAGRVTRLRAYEPAPLRAGGALVIADVLTLPFEVQP
ncbi:MAG: FHA domain-containing protein [Janthinobacterium lividum]